MERVGKYGLFIRRKVQKDFDITAEAADVVNSMLVFLVEKVLKKVLIVIEDAKTIPYTLIFWLLSDFPQDLSFPLKEYIRDILEGKQILVFPTKRTENLMRSKTCKRIGQASVKTMTAILEYFCSHILSMSSQQTNKRGKKRINSEDVRKAVMEHKGLSEIFGHGIFMGR